MEYIYSCMYDLVGNVKLEEIILDEVNKTNVKPKVVNQGLNVIFV